MSLFGISRSELADAINRYIGDHEQMHHYSNFNIADNARRQFRFRDIENRLTALERASMPKPATPLRAEDV